MDLSKNFISLGFFTSIAKYFHEWHPMISDIPVLANDDFLFLYIHLFESKYHSETIFDTIAPLYIRNSSICHSMYSSFCSIGIKKIPVSNHHESLLGFLALASGERIVCISLEKSSLVVIYMSVLYLFLRGKQVWILVDIAYYFDIFLSFNRASSNMNISRESP